MNGAENRAINRVMSNVRGRLVPMLALSLLFLAAPGCQILGYMAHVTGNNPKVPAHYYPAQEPMLILVENYRNPGGGEADCAQLAGYIQQILTDKKVVPIIDAGKLHELKMARGDAYGKMKTSEVAAAVGARQVLYVDLHTLDVTVPSGGGIFQGSIQVRVKVVSDEGGRTLWPVESVEGHPLVSQTNWMARDAGMNEHSARDQMLRGAALTIARLFYDYDPQE